MLKIVVYDGGYGGELFADKLEEELPVAKVIRVIDWRNSEKLMKSSASARRAAKEALRPYIGRVDLIIFANYLLSATSLKFFQRKYHNQFFVGFGFPQIDTFVKRPTIALTTKSLARTISYHSYLFRINRRVNTLCLDDWPSLIDDGELTKRIVCEKFENFYHLHHYYPKEVILVCSQFHDIIPLLRETLGRNIRIHDSTRDTINEVGKILKIRGGTGKKKK